MDVITVMLLKWPRAAHEQIECDWISLQTTSNAAVKLRANWEILLF